MQDKNFFILICLSVLFHSCVLAESPRIEIIYPKSGQTVYAQRETFVLGNILPETGELRLNGKPISVYRTGGFCIMAPLQPGQAIWNFELFVEEELVQSLDHKVRVFQPKSLQVTRDLLIENDHFQPENDLGVVPGEEVLFQCKTLPGKQVICDIQGGVYSVPLHEDKESNVEGIYRGRFAFWKPLEEATIEYKVWDDASIAPWKSPATLTVKSLATYPVYEVIKDGTKARYKPGGGYDSFLVKGTRLASSGFEAGWVRLLLSSRRQVYVSGQEIKSRVLSVLPGQGRVGNIHVMEDDQSLQIALHGLGKVNHAYLRESPVDNTLKIRFFNTHADIDRITQDSEVQSLQEILWSQHADDELDLSIELDFPPHYGVSLDWKSNKAVWTIRKPFAPESSSPLHVCLDAGHGPESGAIGPTGVTEEKANLKLAEVLRDALIREGHKVSMIRSNAEGPGLYDRVPLAKSQKADLFISLHLNATGDGRNPYKERGTETYYYNQAGKALAEALHPALVQVTGIRDKGVRFGNFAVCRNMAMPAVLLEIDYLIIPEAEERVLQSTFQEAVAESIIKGLGNYLK